MPIMVSMPDMAPFLEHINEPLAWYMAFDLVNFFSLIKHIKNVYIYLVSIGTHDNP